MIHLQQYTKIKLTIFMNTLADKNAADIQFTKEIKGRDEPNHIQGAIYKINVIAATVRHLIHALVLEMVIIINSHIAEYHLQMNHRIAWDSAKCINHVQHKIQSMTHSVKLFYQLGTNANRALQLPATYNDVLTTSTKQIYLDISTYLQ